MQYTLRMRKSMTLRVLTTENNCHSELLPADIACHFHRAVGKGSYHGTSACCCKISDRLACSVSLSVNDETDFTEDISSKTQYLTTNYHKLVGIGKKRKRSDSVP